MQTRMPPPAAAASASGWVIVKKAAGYPAALRVTLPLRGPGGRTLNLGGVFSVLKVRWS